MPVTEGPLRFTLAVKAAPGVPSFVKNYVLGMVGIPFALYFGLSLLVTGAYAALCIVLGESLLTNDSRLLPRWWGEAFSR